MTRITLEDAYLRIEFLPSSRNWWSRLKGTPPACVHINADSDWIATLLPDTLYLRGKRAQRRETVRPEVSMCRDCLLETTGGELAAFEGRVVAFEPDPEVFTQYFFVAVSDFQAAGVAPETAAAIEKRLAQRSQSCAECSLSARWLWMSRDNVAGLDEVENIREAPGEWYCAKHGAQKLAAAFEAIPAANVFYMNLPYGDAGAYMWI